ncbi:2-oxoacid:acceptor oxidoreductase subunit alpha [Wenzhouxiangella sp. XN79A]|uniref:2-oxoacid:acceptor oxidoreductase subunit alpha n=1 Tax=Wenzhouxiangella sp. XN79A TaxID=2724193 RepID=UPI00144ABBC7|nr:2-oxoacid:acceptor oxidoreductase subunit alpha [Wenzhouxiangella sp. XN79A]NKI34211.1 2-oxoacid:acceptor oxidoreductase subunit alpha [Wenzhouxiangella sp. XN79A]
MTTHAAAQPPPHSGCSPAGTLSIAISGSGGAGVMTVGELLLDAAARAGLYGRMGRTFGPQIRGGEAAALLRLSSTPIEGVGDAYDLLVALDWGNIDRFADEIPLSPDSQVLFDDKAGEVPPVVVASGANCRGLPLSETARAVRGGRPNLVVLGLLAGALDLPAALVREAVRARFGERSVETALAVLELGLATEPPLSRPLSPSRAAGVRWNVSGNQAAGLGALRGGIRFVAAYPITPATDLLEWLAEELPAADGDLVQAEDELAAVNMCIGASFGGVPSLTATSGPGLALMLEAIGLSVASETPIVVVDVMRGGPSTGIPTKSEQTDLDIAVNGLHGEAPHLVLAPLGVADCLFTTQWSVELAEALQAPAIVLSDQSLAQSRLIVDEPPTRSSPATRRCAESPGADYRRYAITDDGVSPMAIPGTPGGMYVADGLTHDVRGRPSSRSADHRAQLDKRRDKLTGFDFGAAWGEVDGDGAAAVITWGSSTAAVREAVDRLRAAGCAVRCIALRLISPLPIDALRGALAGVERAVVVEHNHSGQLHRLLRANADWPCPLTAWHRPGPLPLRPGELVAALSEALDARPNREETPA